MIPAFALIGFTSIVSQIVLLRELLVVLYGNELPIGAILAAWLLWVAAGAALAGAVLIPILGLTRAAPVVAVVVLGGSLFIFPKACSFR